MIEQSCHWMVFITIFKIKQLKQKKIPRNFETLESEIQNPSPILNIFLKSTLFPLILYVMSQNLIIPTS